MSRSLIGLLTALALGCGGRTAPRPGIGEGEAEAEAEAEAEGEAEAEAEGGDGMVNVPAGPFWMGCNEALDSECLGDEYPYHEVMLSAFRIDRTEVTVADYAACVDAGVCTSPEWACNWGAAGREDHPINCVDWFQADAYCAWADKRLPTEAEWEKAARGSDGRLYPWGSHSPTCALANYADCALDASVVVGSYADGASQYGALDMAGNVWEWTADWYDESYYDQSPPTDPRGPAEGTWRVMRGGSWIALAGGLRACFRIIGDPSPFSGFRCASDP